MNEKHTPAMETQGHSNVYQQIHHQLRSCTAQTYLSQDFHVQWWTVENSRCDHLVVTEALQYLDAIPAFQSAQNIAIIHITSGTCTTCMH